MIGVFGDSYGVEVSIETGYFSKGWPTILGELYNEEVENFCESGTSISYSYQKFCEQDLSKYSKVIFLSTYAERQLFINHSENEQLFFQGGFKQSKWLNNIDSIKKIINVPELTKNHLRVLEYQEHINAMYPDTWDYFHRAISRDVMHSHKNALVLDASLLGNIGTIGLNSEMAPWFTAPKGGTWQKYYESSDLGRVCHCSRQQNIELAGHVKDYFDTGFEINSALEEAHLHFSTPTSLEDAGLTVREQSFDYE